MYSPSRLLRLALAALFPALFGCTAAEPPARLAIAGSIVSMAPPPGFTPAPNFSGFVAEEGRASIMVAELPTAAAEQIATLFTDLPAARHNFASQGVQVSGMETLQVQQAQVPVVTGTQDGHGLTFNKWVAFYRGAKPVLVTVQIPTGSTIKASAVMAALQSVTLGTPPTLEERVGALPFMAEPTAPFRIVDTLGGSGLLMTAGELDVDPEGVQPMVIVASQLSLPVGANTPADLADTLLPNTRGLEHALVQSRNPVPFAGTEGELITGVTPEGRHFVHYLALWPGKRFVRLAAILPPGQEEALQPQIEAIAASVHFRD